MRVFVAGGTGVIGRPTVAALLAGGHTVMVAVRDPDAARWAEGLGANPASVDLFDEADVRRTVDGSDAIINLATSIPPTSRAAFSSAWAMNHRLRREAARHLAAAAVATGAEVLVQESLGFAYADHGATVLDEDTPLVPSAPMASIVEAETAVAGAAAEGMRGVVLRFGQFYGASSVQTREMLTTARRGLLPLFGRDEAYWPFVHVADAAAAVTAAAVEAPTGVYHVTDDDPLTRREHAEVLGAALGRRLRRPPALLASRGPIEPVGRSIRPANARLRAATSWRPELATTREGWPVVVAALEAS